MVINTAVESLRLYDMDETECAQWETSLGLTIPTDEQGVKRYSPLHIKLFQNIKKHLSLGRTLDEIRHLIVLPPGDVLTASTPRPQQPTASSGMTSPFSTSAAQVMPRTVHSDRYPIIEEEPPFYEESGYAPDSYEAALYGSDAYVPTEGFESEESPWEVVESASYMIESDSPVGTELDPMMEIKAVGLQTPEPARSDWEHQLEDVNQTLAQQPSSTQSALSARLKQELSGEISMMGLVAPADPENSDAAITLFDVSVAKRQPLSSSMQKKINRFASVPSSPLQSATNTIASRADANTSLSVASAKVTGQQGDMLLLVDRLMTEKDDLMTKLQDMEKLNAHLYQTNGLYQKRIDEMNQLIASLQKQLDVHDNVRLLSEKTELQKQLIQLESQHNAADKTIAQLSQQIDYLDGCIQNKTHPQLFIGHWLEEATLKAIDFDNFGVNIEPERSRLFTINSAPERIYASTAMIEVSYDYQANTLWKRQETLIAVLMDENRIEGELIAEFVLDGAPVARAIYSVVCYRQVNQSP